MIQNGNSRWKEELRDGQNAFEKKIRCSYYVDLNMAKNDYFSTLRLGYLKILSCQKNLENRFVFRIWKPFKDI